MPRNLLVTIDHADGRFRGHEREWFPDERVRDGVIVAVEANVGRLARGDGLHVARVERMLGQRQEALLLVGEGLGDGAGGVSGNATTVDDAIDPGVELLIEIRKGRERARREEGLAEVADPSLDAALFVAARDADGGGSEVIGSTSSRMRG